MEEKVILSMLIQTYGKLLTEKQYQIMDDYYNNDLSLSEIAQNHNITRQAVRDIIKKGEKKLFEYEEKLLFMKRTLNTEKKIEKVLSFLPAEIEIIRTIDSLKNNSCGKKKQKKE